MRAFRRGVTLVELTLVMVLGGILAATTPALMFQSVQTVAFLPRAQATHRVAMESLQAIVEGNSSTLTGLAGQSIRGLRAAARETTASSTQPAIWLAERNRIGYLLPHDPLTMTDNQYVVIRLDGTQIKRAVYASAACPPPSGVSEEVLPYDAGTVTVTNTGATPLFTYFTAGQAAVSPPGCGSAATIRRVAIAFTAQTGAGNFDQGDARVEMRSSVAVRFP